MPCFVSESPFLSICALARMTMPGMQNPHCRPPQAENASANRCRSSSATPSSVVTDLPSALATSYWHDTVAFPSISTVQQPHWPDGEQPSFGDVMSSSSRSAASRCGWSDRTVTGVPFTSNDTARSSCPVEGVSMSSVTLYSLSNRLGQRNPPLSQPRELRSTPPTPFVSGFPRTGPQKSRRKREIGTAATVRGWSEGR